VRVIEYTRDRDPDTGRPLPASKRETYRLVTTILDPAQAPAEELAELYGQRWEHETLLDEIKVHQQDNRWSCARGAPTGSSRKCGASSPCTGPCGN
jgi:IS4 transposase